MIVLGVDPGTRVTGYGVLDGARGTRRARLVECGAVRASAKDPLAARLGELFEGLSEVIERVRPEVVSVEGLFYGRNVRTMSILGHARGVVLLAAARQSVRVVEYPPAQVKKAIVGTGMAGKDQVAFMVQQLLGLTDPPEPSDAADGIALALCHLFHDGQSARARAERSRDAGAERSRA